MSDIQEKMTISGTSTCLDDANIRELIAENERLKAENKELKQKVPPIENGTNRYGLDVSYFRNLINRELNRGLSDFKPDEIARVFARMSKAADSDVLKEREFCTD